MLSQLIDSYAASGEPTGALILADYLDEQGEELAAHRLRFVFETDWEPSKTAMPREDDYRSTGLQIRVEMLARSLATAGFMLFFWAAQDQVPAGYSAINSWPEDWTSQRYREVVDRVSRQILLEACGVQLVVDEQDIRSATRNAWQAADNATTRVVRRAATKVAWRSRCVEESRSRPAWSVWRLTDSLGHLEFSPWAYTLFERLGKKENAWSGSAVP